MAFTDFVTAKARLMNRCFNHLAALLILIIGAVFGIDTVLKLVNQADDFLVTLGIVSAFMGLWIFVVAIRRIYTSWKNIPNC
jgi:hypothetical protein